MTQEEIGLKIKYHDIQAVTNEQDYKARLATHGEDAYTLQLLTTAANHATLALWLRRILEEGGYGRRFR